MYFSSTVIIMYHIDTTHFVLFLIHYIFILITIIYDQFDNRIVKIKNVYTIIQNDSFY